MTDTEAEQLLQAQRERHELTLQRIKAGLPLTGKSNIENLIKDVAAAMNAAMSAAKAHENIP